MTELSCNAGRPSKFTSERCKAIIEDISNCIPYELAAEANGIGERTLYDWLTQGRYDLEHGIQSDFAIFSQSLKNIEKEKIKELLVLIKSNPKRWQAQAWILERRWWKFFSSKAENIEFQKQLDEMRSLLENKNGEAKGSDS